MNDDKFTASFPTWYSPKPSEMERFNNDTLQHTDFYNIIHTAFKQISIKFPNYQLRTSQLEMSVLILESLYFEKSALIEAGTGIGKSFAYIIASLAYSYLSGNRILITTETKNLQMQIYEKDLVFIQNNLDNELTYALCLGSGNYFCKLRYEETMEQGLFRDIVEKNELEQIKNWVDVVTNQSLQGHIYEIPFIPTNSFWQMINRDSDGCPATKCNHFKECNYFRTKKIWNESRLLISNHHLVLYNLQNDKKTLPPYSTLVIDEAHGFLKTAYSIFTNSFNSDSLNEYKKSYDKIFIKNKNLPQDLQNDFSSLWKSLTDTWTLFFSSYQNALELSYEEDATKIIAEDIKLDVKPIIQASQNIIKNINDHFKEEQDSQNQNYINSFSNFLHKMIMFFEAYAKINFDKYVYWAQKNKNIFTLNVCAINLSDSLSELFIEQQIWTSATLGYWSKDILPKTKEEAIANGYFDSFIKSIYNETTTINDFNANIFKSPFNYKDNVLLYIPQHITPPEWDISQEKKTNYQDNLIEEIIKLIELSKGGALILFTSLALLDIVANKLKHLIDYPIYSQTKHGTQKSIEEFTKSNNAILLGAYSFWQGVDIPGDKLRMLIITKLMFTPPEDPIYKARSIQIENQKRSSFTELALPYTNSMLKQGFGRLVRRETDKGIVAILDNRLLTKFYGKKLINNLPNRQSINTFQDLVRFTNEKNIFK